MATMQVVVPLFPSADYAYNISFERVAYTLRFYFNERAQQWYVDLRYAGGEPIVLGEAVVDEYPMFLDYGLPEMTGYFWLEPIGKKQNETVNNPLQIWDYYNLYYIYEE